MTRYIYFYDTDSITPCEDDDDVFDKIVTIRKRTPDRHWALIEESENGEYKIVMDSHRHIESRKFAIVTALIALAVSVFIIFCYSGLLF